jgi:hypothetical protein
MARTESKAYLVLTQAWQASPKLTMRPMIGQTHRIRERRTTLTIPSTTPELTTTLLTDARTDTISMSPGTTSSASAHRAAKVNAAPRHSVSGFSGRREAVLADAGGRHRDSDAAICRKRGSRTGCLVTRWR